MSYILGLDVSYAQGKVADFAAAKAAGYVFWLQRMSYAYPETGCKLDDTANTNYYGAKAAGFVVGGYHKIGWTDPVVEADFFLAAMNPLAEGDLLAYDKEPSSDVPVPPNWSEWEQAFVTRIHDQTDVWPFDYSDISMYNAMPRTGVVQNCGPWVAAPSYSFDATLPVKDTVVMQQGPAVHVAGIPDNVTDTDAFFGTIDELLKYAYHLPVNTTPSLPPTTTTTLPPDPPTGAGSTTSSSSSTTTLPPATSTTSLIADVTPPNRSSQIDDDLANLDMAINDAEKGVERFIVSNYNKLLVGIAGTVLSYLASRYGANHIIQDVIYIATVLGIYQVPNVPPTPPL